VELLFVGSKQATCCGAAKLSTIAERLVEILYGLKRGHSLWEAVQLTAIVERLVDILYVPGITPHYYEKVNRKELAGIGPIKINGATEKFKNQWRYLFQSCIHRYQKRHQKIWCDSTFKWLFSCQLHCMYVPICTYKTE